MTEGVMALGAVPARESAAQVGEVGYADRHPLYSSNVTDRRVALVLRGQF